MTPDAAEVTAILLCGGGSTRFATSGARPADKTDQPLGGTTVLATLLDSLPEAWGVVAVGRARPLPRPVTWTREDPPGGGPVAAIAAALPLVTTPVVVVLAGDMPFAGPPAARLVEALSASHPGDALDAMTARGKGDRPNALFCAYRTQALRRALPPAPANARAGRLLDALSHGTLVVQTDESLDVDTPEALEQARHRLGP